MESRSANFVFDLLLHIMQIVPTVWYFLFSDFIALAFTLTTTLNLLETDHYDAI